MINQVFFVFILALINSVFVLVVISTVFNPCCDRFYDLDAVIKLKSKKEENLVKKKMVITPCSSELKVLTSVCKFSYTC